ncbi:MAG: sensor domain-containing protein, partial [Phycisphaerales bacterium]
MPDAAIRGYLAQLAAALEGCDAALRHDALLDAEAHLRAAVRAGTPAERAIADYGLPAEIARAYRDADDAPAPWRGGPASAPDAAGSSLESTAAPTVRRGFRRLPVIGVWAQPEAWGALLYFGVVGFVLATAYFVWTVSIGGVALGLLPTLLGFPIFVALLGSARALCLFEGRVVQALLGVRMPRRTQPVAGADSVGFWQRIWCWLRDVRSWMSLAYLLGNFPVSVATFAITLVLVVLSAVMLAMPIPRMSQRVAVMSARPTRNAGCTAPPGSQTSPCSSGTRRIQRNCIWKSVSTLKDSIGTPSPHRIGMASMTALSTTSTRVIANVASLTGKFPM